MLIGVQHHLAILASAGDEQMVDACDSYIAVDEPGLFKEIVELLLLIALALPERVTALKIYDERDRG